MICRRIPSPLHLILLAAACGSLLAGPPSKDAKAKALQARVKAKAQARAKAEAHAIDINHATKAQLKTLPGITDALADRILAHRPYLTKEHLVLNHALEQGEYLRIRDRIVIRYKASTPAKKPAAPKKK